MVYIPSRARKIEGRNICDLLSMKEQIPMAAATSSHQLKQPQAPEDSIMEGIRFRKFSLSGKCRASRVTLAEALTSFGGR